MKRTNNLQTPLLGLLVLALFFTAGKKSTSTWSEFQTKLSKSLSKLNSCSFIISKKEKMRGQWLSGSSYVSNDLSNRTTHVRTIAPRANIIVDYPGDEEEQAKVHLDFFPYLTGHVSPYSRVLLRDQHHPITHLTPSYFIKIIENYLQTCEDYEHCNLDDLENEIVRIQFTPIPRPSYSYTVKRETSVIELADSLRLNPYRIYELNDEEIKYDDPIIAGTKLTLPPYYADKAVFWLSKEHLLPIKVQFFQGQNLYEEYQFSSYKLHWKAE